MFCYGDYQLTTRVNQQNEKSTSSFLCVMYVQGASKHHPNIQGVVQTYRRVSKHMRGIQTYGGVHTYWDIKTYRGHPNIQGYVQTYGMCPNIQGVSKHMGASKCMGTYGHSLSVTKHAFFVLCMYSGHPNIIDTYRGYPHIWGCPDIQGTAKHKGTQTNRGHPNIIQTYRAVSKHTGASNHKVGVQTYRRVSKHIRGI